MANNPYRPKPLPPHKEDDNDCPTCEEIDSPTQRSINLERDKYCLDLSVAAGEVSKSEQNYDGISIQYEHKKCLFIWIQENYHIYRNLMICVGAELTQTTDLIKENIASYIKLSNDLTGVLKNISKSAKDIKTKFGELREQACKLENCKNDSCNSTQWALLTGKNPENCKGEQKPPAERPAACNDIEDIFEELICMPKALGFDIDSLTKSSAEVIGIQVFSNISTLDLLHQTFITYSKEFDKQILDALKLRESDMKTQQEDLVKTVKEMTKSVVMRNRKRSDFEGLKHTLEYICCPDCDCIDGEGDNCKPRLKACECELCHICENVKTTFCPVVQSERHEHAAM